MTQNNNVGQQPGFAEQPGGNLGIGFNQQPGFGTGFAEQPAWMSGQFPPPQLPAPAPAPKKHRRWPWLTLGAVVVVIVVAAIAGNSGNGNTSTTASGSTQADTASSPTALPSPPPDDMVTVPTDLVGKTVAAASQELAGVGISKLTLSGPQGLDTALSACGNSGLTDPACAQLQVSSVAQAGQQLDVTQDDRLTLTVVAVIPPGGASTITQDGTYVVGQDIAAGTWHTDGQGSLGSCYWEKDKDLNGDFNSIIANDNVSGPTTLTIAKSTVAFKVDGGCTWTKE